MTAVLLGDLNMLRCFADSTVSFVVAPSADDTAVLGSRYVRSPSRAIASFTEPQSALADLEALAVQIARDPRHPRGAKPVLFYGNDRQLLAISRNRERVAESFEFLMPDAELLEILVDKSRFGTHAAALGLPVPETISARDAGSPDGALAAVPLPCVLKPTTHIEWFAAANHAIHGGQKAVVAHTADELRALWRDVAAITHDDFIVQHYIPGGEDRIHSYHAYIDAHGAVLAEFAGRKLRTFPRTAGASTYLTLVDAPDVLALGRDVAAKLGLVGPMKLDFKRHPTTGSLYLLEVNPRFNLWHYLGATCGINLPLVAHADLTGAPLPAIETRYAKNVCWLAFSDDLRSFLRDYRPAGELSWTSWLASFGTRKVYDVFAWRDPMPWLRGLAAHGRALHRKLLDRGTPA